MNSFLEVKCPECDTILIIDRVTGKVLETRKPLLKNSSGDRFQDSLTKVKQGTKEAENLFKKSMEAEKTKSKDLNELFEKSLDQVKQQGPITPEKNILDQE